MSSDFRIERYSDDKAAEWDRFIVEDAVNGTFLQSRKFLGYHPEERFEDCSLLVRKGESIVAIVPACVKNEEGARVFSSHGGSTFGGVVIDRRCQPTSKALSVVKLIDQWVKESGFDRIELKLTPEFFSKEETSVLDYALQHEGYSSFGEISYVIDFAGYPDPVESNFTSSRRRDCRYSARNPFEFRRLSADCEIADFYGVLKRSLLKYDAEPVHSLPELLEFKNDRLSDVVRFYGVYLEDALVAGSMVFSFDGRVFHTQYLAADPEHLELFPMNFLDWNLIREAKEEGFAKFSFGISTEDHGREVNLTLATFKEGFGCSHSINRTFVKRFGE